MHKIDTGKYAYAVDSIITFMQSIKRVPSVDCYIAYKHKIDTGNLWGKYVYLQ